MRRTTTFLVLLLIAIACTHNNPTLPITGSVPDAREPPSGCRFRDRCPHAFARCAVEMPALRRTSDGHSVACHLE